MPREPNDIDADEYNDRIFADPEPERDPMDVYKDMLEAEDAERAAEELRESGKFGSVEHGKDYNGSLQLDCVSALKQSALQAHSDFCLANGLPKPKAPELLGGGGYHGAIPGAGGRTIFNYDLPGGIVLTTNIPPNPGCAKMAEAFKPRDGE